MAARPCSVKKAVFHRAVSGKYPTVTDAEAAPLRPERHIPNSIATMHPRKGRLRRLPCNKCRRHAYLDRLLTQLFVTCGIGDESMQAAGEREPVIKWLKPLPEPSDADALRGTACWAAMIERQTWMFDERTEWDEQSLRAEQYSRMLRLKKYYGIAGGKNLYPIEGVGPTDWLPWYELALGSHPT